MVNRSTAWYGTFSSWLPNPVRDAGVAEGLEEPVEEDLGLALFVAGDVLAHPVAERCQLRGAGIGHCGHDSRGVDSVGSAGDGRRSSLA